MRLQSLLNLCISKHYMPAIHFLFALFSPGSYVTSICKQSDTGKHAKFFYGYWFLAHCNTAAIFVWYGVSVFCICRVNGWIAYSVLWLAPMNCQLVCVIHCSWLQSSFCVQACITRKKVAKIITTYSMLVKFSLLSFLFCSDLLRWN